MFKVLAATGVSLFFNDRKLYDIAATSCAEQWPAARASIRRGWGWWWVGVGV
jgi:hypothetical protein